jgi:NTE family protein
VIAVIALTTGAPADAVAESVAASLSASLRVTTMGEARPQELQRAEADHDRVLLVAGAEGSWAASCRRQADWVVLVSEDPMPSGASHPEAPCDVVLTGAAPTSVQILRWHDEVGCRRVIHAGTDRRGWPGRLRELHARLAGQSVGLVLAGGGARSLAHLGVLHAFEDAGVTVDRVAGSSMGALIAALYATGATAGEVDDRVFDEFVRRRPFGDFRPSLTSLAKGERGNAMLRRCFGDIRLEELPRELVVVSTDLYERAPVYHRRGSTAEVVGASLCVPVLFPPRRIGGRTLVDGTLTDNCPVGPLCEHPEGPVVAVHFGNASSPAGEDPPSLGETLLLVMQMGDRRAEEDPSKATVTVVPDTTGIGLLEFHQIDHAREAGREAGEAALAALRQSGLLTLGTSAAPPERRETQLIT